ncbi:MAG: hypothetical protein NUW37_06455 [Planctomycetes bacterium]|nr:hypothetical protein [Planctomycetota bacterium]
MKYLFLTLFAVMLIASCFDLDSFDSAQSDKQFTELTEANTPEEQLQIWRNKRVLAREDSAFYISFAGFDMDLNEYDCDVSSVLTQKNAHYLAELTNLNTFAFAGDFSNAAIDDSVFSYLSELHNLNFVSISGAFFGDRTLEIISKLPQLTDLILHWETGRVTNQGIAYFRNNNRLTSLTLAASTREEDGYALDNEGIEIVSTISTLEVLDVNCFNISSQAISDIAKLEELWMLRIDGLAQEDVDYSPLTSLGKLKALYIDLPVSESTKDQIRQMFSGNNQDMDISFGSSN